MAPGQGGRVLRSILLVDDEPDLLELMAQFVRDSFPTAILRTATTGGEALTVLREHPIHVIVSDYKLPGMDGIALLGEASRIRPGIRKALVTAFADSSLEERGRAEAGIDLFLAKTFDPQDFLTALGALLG